MTHKKMLIWLYNLTYKNKEKLCEFCGKKIIIQRVSPKLQRIYLSCGHYINPLKNTFLYKTRISLTRWWKFMNIYKDSTLTTSVASKILGVSQMSAWRIMKKIKQATPDVKIDSDRTLQIDELFFGSSKRNSHKQRLNTEELKEYNKYKNFNSRKRKDTYLRKEVVFGIASSNKKYILIRSGITAYNMADLKSKRLRIYWKYFWSFILHNYAKNNIIFHDGDKTVDKIINDALLESATVSHNKNQFVKVDKDRERMVTTNAIEGAFGRFVRTMKGVQTHSKNHLDAYLIEYSYRTSYSSDNISNFWARILCKG